MKKTFFIILLAVCFVSCKKEQHTNAPLKKYKLSFDVSGFTQTTGPFTPNSQRKITNSTTDTLSAFVDKLVYRLYDSKQKIITSKTQLSSQPNYTLFTDSLPPGTYTAVFIGGKNGLTLSQGPSTSNDTDDVINYGDNSPWNDLFYKKISITVNGELKQAVQLNRAVAQLQLKILDQIPANVAKFQLTYKDYYRFNFLTGIDTYFINIYETDYGPFTLNNPLSAGSIGTTNYTIQTYTLNNSKSPFDLNIYAYDSSGKLIVQKTVLNVMCALNKRTIVSGNLFSTSDRFVITTDTVWNTTSIQHPF